MLRLVQTPTLNTWQAVEWNIPRASPSVCLAICGHGVSQAGKAGAAVYLGMGLEIQQLKVGEIEKNSQGLGRMEILSSENLSEIVKMQEGVTDGDWQGLHTCSAVITTRQTLQWEKGEWKQICHSVCCLHRSYVSMCNLFHTNIPLKTHTYPTDRKSVV